MVKQLPASRHGEAAQRTCAFEDARHEPSACTSAGAVGTSASPSRGSNSSRAPIATKLPYHVARTTRAGRSLALTLDVAPSASVPTSKVS